MILFKTNGQYLRLLGLKDTKTGAFVNDATVTANVYDSTGAAVAGLTNLSLVNIDANGDYEVEISGSISLDSKQRYTANCVAINASGKRYDITRDVRVALRAQ